MNKRLLVEKTRGQLISQSKSADVTKSYGTTRFERRNVQHLYSPKESLNNLDMNALWKSNVLSFKLPVQGETNNYSVEVVFENALDNLNNELKRNNYNFEYKVVYRSIINTINRNDVYVGCTCMDFFYTFSYQATRGQYNANKPQVIPAKVRNPNNSKGAGCKHIMKVLGSLDWALDLASCITNYVLYMQEHYKDKYEEIIFPALYKMSYEKAIDDGIIVNDEEVDIEIDDDNEEPIEDEIEVSDEEEENIE